MKKGLLVLLAIGLIMGSVMAPAASAGKKKKKPAAPKRIERTVEFDYQCPCTGRFQLGSLGAGNIGGGPVPLGLDDVYVSAVATDTSGQPIPVSIDQDTNGDGFNDEVGRFCGETEAPILLSDEREIRIFVGSPDNCPGPALGGSIVFTFSNLP